MRRLITIIIVALAVIAVPAAAWAWSVNLYTNEDKAVVDAVKTGGFGVVIDGGGEAIAVDTQIVTMVPYDLTITEVTLLADQSGSIVVDIWVDSYANYPPTDADSITSSTPPTITTDTDSQNTTLTSWTTSLTGGYPVIFRVDSCTTIERCALIIRGTR